MSTSRSRPPHSSVGLRGVVTGSLVTFGARASGALAALGFNMLVARQLGAQGVGLFTLAFTMMGVAAIIAQLGLPTVLLRFVATTAVNDPNGGPWYVHRVARRWSSCAGLALTVLVVVSGDTIATEVFSEPDLSHPLRLMCIGILPVSLITLQGEALKGLHRVGQGQAIQSLLGPALSVAFLITLADRLTLDLAISAHLVALLLAWIAGAWLWRRQTSPPCRVRSHDQTIVDNMKVAARPLFATSLLLLIMTFADTVILGIWHDSTEVGAYFIALRIAAVTTMIASAVSAVLGPRFATLWGAGRLSDIADLASVATSLMALTAIVVTAVLIISAESVLTLFGSEFADASSILIVLAIGQFTVLSAGPVSSLLTMTGHERKYRDAVVVGALLNVVLNLALVPSHAGLGAAIATSISLAVQHILIAGFAWWRILTLRG